MMHDHRRMACQHRAGTARKRCSERLDRSAQRDDEQRYAHPPPNFVASFKSHTTEQMLLRSTVADAAARSRTMGDRDEQQQRGKHWPHRRQRLARVGIDCLVDLRSQERGPTLRSCAAEEGGGEEGKGRKKAILGPIVATFVRPRLMATPSRLLGAAAAVGVAGIAFMLARKRNEAESRCVSSACDRLRWRAGTGRDCCDACTRVG